MGQNPSPHIVHVYNIPRCKMDRPCLA